MEYVRFAVSALCTLAGLFMVTSAILGVYRLRSSLSRLHAAALLDTLGMLFLLLGLIIAQGPRLISLKMLLLIVFLWLTSPVGSHLIARLETMVHPDLGKEVQIDRTDMVRQLREE